MKRKIALFLALVMSVSVFTGCGKAKDPAAEGSKDPAAVEGVYGTFKNYFLSDIDTINPHIYTLSDSGTVITMSSLRLYTQVPTSDGKGFDRVGELAKSEPKQMDEEGKIWQIPLYDTAKWENGDKINVDDVLYSFQMCLDPKLVNSRASQLASDYITVVNAKEYALQGTEDKVKWDDVGFKRIDDYTLGLELTDAVTAEDIKYHFYYTWTVLVHKPTYEACMNEDRTINTYGSDKSKYMSCGSYLLSDWISGSLIQFKRNPDYTLADNIKLEGYLFKIVGDRNTALELFLNNELDVVSLSPEAVEQYLDDPRVMVAPAASNQTISINHQNTNNNAILGNVNFRQALYYAVDRESIAKMTNGIAANYILPQKCLGLDGQAFRDMKEAQEYLPANTGYDVKKAKELYDKAMKECGLDKLTLTLQYNETSANNKAVSEYLHKELPTIFGDTFTLELMAAPSSVLSTYIKGWKNGDPNSYELQWRGWDSSATAPWNAMKVYTTSYSNKNEPYFNETYDKIWEEANYDIAAKLDPSYRLDLTRQLEKIALEDVVVVPVYEAPSYSLVSEKVTLPSNGYITGYGFGYDLAAISK